MIYIYTDNSICDLMKFNSKKKATEIENLFHYIVITYHFTI